MTTPTEIRSEPAWACFATDGRPYPFIHSNSVSDTREDAQMYMGGTWVHDDETWQQGWRRAYRHGWRCVKVTVSAGAPHD